MVSLMPRRPVQCGVPSEHEDPLSHFRQVLGHFPTGVAIVTALNGGEPVGMTIQSFCSLSLEPPLVLICPSLASTSWPRIEPVGRLCVNLLSDEQEGLARQFARSGTDKYSGVPWTMAPRTGSPVLDGGLAWMDCEVVSTFPGGDHIIVTCRVLDLRVNADVKPLVFFQSGFRRGVHA